MLLFYRSNHGSFYLFFWNHKGCKTGSRDTLAWVPFPSRASDKVLQAGGLFWDMIPRSRRIGDWKDWRGRRKSQSKDVLLSWVTAVGNCSSVLLRTLWSVLWNACKLSTQEQQSPSSPFSIGQGSPNGILTISLPGLCGCPMWASHVAAVDELG